MGRLASLRHLIYCAVHLSVICLTICVFNQVCCLVSRRCHKSSTIAAWTLACFSKSVNHWLQEEVLKKSDYWFSKSQKRRKRWLHCSAWGVIENRGLRSERELRPSWVVKPMNLLRRSTNYRHFQCACWTFFYLKSTSWESFLAASSSSDIKNSIIFLLSVSGSNSSLRA